VHRYNALTHFSLNRQKSLEDSLLVAGQFKDALQLLLDWLYKVEPGLNEDQPVHGDIDTVNSLIEQHKVNLICCCYVFSFMFSSSSSSRMCVMNHNWSATKQRLHLQSVAEISRHSALSGTGFDNMRQHL